MTLFTAYFCMGIVAASLGMNFALLWFDKQPMTQEFMAVVTTYGAITSTLTFGGYVALNAIRHTSVNKTQRSKIENMGGSPPVYHEDYHEDYHENYEEENDA